MVKLLDVLALVTEQLTISTDLLHDIATRFQRDMVDGLAGRPSSLKMLPSFITSPTGKEHGKVLAIDFGGTNVRVLLVELKGSGKVNIIDRRSVALKDKLGHYDYTSSEISGTELFDFIAGKIAEIVPAEGFYPLGHTFSFPCRQYGINEAILISWTKEIRTAGVEGENVGQLLQYALKRKGVGHVKPVTVINDTTGTLLAAAYTEGSTCIGSICGTGHNSCYLEPDHPLTGKTMIVNLESGNFNGIYQTKYDKLLDQASKQPGAQQLEKMASGQYLGELVRLIVSGIAAEAHSFQGNGRLNAPYSLPTEDITPILADMSKELSAVANVAMVRWGLDNLTWDELMAIKTVALLVTVRSARLVAATWVGVLLKIDPGFSQRHTIAVDGSLYEKLPGYAVGLVNAMIDILGDKAEQVTITLSKDGSGIGAAIAAATAHGMR